MWVGTLSGLNRYDGKRVNVYMPESNQGSITSSVIFSLYEDSNNRLWIGTDGGGLNRYWEKKNIFTSYKHDLDNPSSLSSDKVYAILEDRDGTLWIGTGGGGLNHMIKEGEFFAYRADNTSTSLKSDIIRTLYQGPMGTLLIGTEKGGLSVLQLENKIIKTYTSSDEPGAIPSNTVRAILEDSRGTIWIGMQNGGLAQFDLNEGIFIPFYISGLKEQKGITVRALYEDKKKNLWVGTEKNGIYIYSLTDKDWHVVKNDGYGRTGLSSNTIRSIYADKNGLIWIGTRDGGVNLYNSFSTVFKNIIRNKRNRFYKKPKQPRDIIQSSDGILWYATDGGGLNSYNWKTKEIKNFSKQTSGGGLTTNQCYSLVEDSNGIIWVGTDGGGINLFDPESESWVKNYKTGDGSNLTSDTIWDIFIDSDNNLWVGTEGGGLDLFDRNNEIFISYQYDPKNIYSLSGNSIRDIYEDSKGRLWIGTWDGGLNLYQKEKEAFLRFKFDPESDSSMSDNSVNVIYEDSKRRLWIGTTGGGLNLLDNDGYSFHSFSEEDGLAGDDILGITEDNNKNLWITTDNGLNLYLEQTGKFYTFSREDGLLNNEFTHKSLCSTSEGTIFVGGVEGINYFDPDLAYNIIKQKNNAKAIFTDFYILNNKVPIGKQFNGREILQNSIINTHSITLSQNEQFLTFYFAILDYVAPERNMYYTYLDGYDKNWSFRGNNNFITFDSLPYGNYKLQIKGTNHLGVEVPGVTELEITILPHFWQTIYFKLISVLFLLILVSFYIRQRTKALEKHNKELRMFSTHIVEVREEERKRVARDVHDELGQILTALKMEIFRFSEKEKTKSMLALVNLALESVKTLSTRIRPKALDTLSLSEALNWQTVEFQRRTDYSCTVEIEDIEDDFDKQTGTVVFRIYQEILTNIIRHSKADHVFIHFYKNGNVLCLQVRDNGKGIPPGKINSSESFGIIGMKERCNMLGGKLKILSRANGTSVELTIPIKNGREAESGSVTNTRNDIREKK